MSLGSRAKLLPPNAKGFISETQCLPDAHKALDLLLSTEERASICKSWGHNPSLYQLLCTKQWGSRFLAALSESSPPPCQGDHGRPRKGNSLGDEVGLPSGFPCGEEIALRGFSFLYGGGSRLRVLKPPTTVLNRGAPGGSECLWVQDTLLLHCPQ